MADVVLQKTGVGMEEGTLLEWQVADGERVGEGQTLAVVETDKVNVELTSPASGVIRLVAREGEVYEIGALLARVEEGGR